MTTNEHVATYGGSDVELTLGFTPTRTAPQHLHQQVVEAFTAAGLTISSWTVPFGEDTDLPGNLKWADPSLSVTIKAEAGVAAARKIAYCLGEALAAIRIVAPQLPFGIRVDSDAQRLWLSLRVMDPCDLRPPVWIERKRVLDMATG